MIQMIAKKLPGKVNNRKGFTLAELLVVVAIIGVLVAIAIPVFSAQLEKARVAVDDANLRSATSMAVADYVLANPDGTGTNTDYYAYSKTTGKTTNIMISTSSTAPTGYAVATGTANGHAKMNITIGAGGAVVTSSWE